MSSNREFFSIDLNKLKDIFQKGLQIEQPDVRPDEAPTQKYILPSGIVFYKGKEYPINLLKRQFGKSLEVEINNSIELLEYEIGTAIRKGLSGKSIKVAFSSGHGELSSTQTADIANSLSEFYSLNHINLNLTDSNCYKNFASDVVNNPQKPVFSILVEGLINQLKSYKGLIIAKPTIEFTEPEKYILDQYVMNGGKIIFLVENLLAEMDSVAKYGQVMTVNHNHNLDDILFQYGVKVKPNLVESTDDFGNPFEKRMVGIQIGANNNTINHVKLGPTKAAYYSAKEIIFVSQKTLSMVWGYIQKLWGKGYGDVRQLGGPIKIAQISGDVAKMGLLPFVIIIAYISISLGLFNLFPIPLLDGGHIALNTIEGIRGKEFNKGTIDKTFRIGFSIVITLMVFTTINDIYNSHEKISAYFKAFFN